MQPRRVAVALPQQQQRRGDELVDLGLQLHFEQGHRFLVLRIPRVIREMTHSLERRPKILEIVAVETVQRIAALEPLEQPLLEVQADLRFTLGLRDQQLLVDLPAAAVERAREARIGGQEIVDAIRQLERVEVAEQTLQIAEQHAASDAWSH